jgi:hypothetical protein
LAAFRQSERRRDARVSGFEVGEAVATLHDLLLDSAGIRSRANLFQVGRHSLGLFVERHVRGVVRAVQRALHIRICRRG